MQTTAPIRIGEWLVEPRGNRISQGDRVFHVEPKIMDLLCFFAQHAGEPVTKEAFLCQLWGDTSVADGALKHLIWEARKLLGDDAREPRFIETIPKMGYCLIAPVTYPKTEETHNRALSRVVGIGKAALIPVLLLLSAVMSIVTFFSDSEPAEEPANRTSEIRQPVRMKAVTLTSYPGLEIDPAISFDGRWLVFSRRNEADFDLHIKDMHGSSVIPLVADPGDETMARWSADGQHLVYRLNAPEHANSGLYMYTLANRHREKLPLPETVGLDHLGWSPDGRTLAISMRQNFWSPIQIMFYDLESKQLTPLSQAETPFEEDRHPEFSPDGSKLAFIRNWTDWSGDLFIIDLSNQENRRLTHDHALIAGLTWSPDSQSLIFSSDRLPPRALWRVNLTKGKPKWLPITVKQPQNPIAARSGSLIFQEVTCDPNLWGITSTDGNMQALQSPLASTKPEYQPAISPDGRQLAFISERTGHGEIWLHDFDQNQLRRLTSLKGPLLTRLHWSPDGDRIIFDARTRNHSRLYQVVVSSAEVTSCLTRGPSRLFPSWSRDGQSFYFAAKKEGIHQIWLGDRVSGDVKQVTHQGGLLAQENWATGDLYFAKREQPGIWKKPADGGPVVPVFPGLSPSDYLNWALTSKGIYFIRSTRIRQEMAYYDFGDQTVRTICRLSFVSPYQGISATPDAETIYFSKVEAYESDLIMVPLGPTP